MIRSVGIWRSMRYATEAPRLSASIPTAPVPENRSKQALSFTHPPHEVEKSFSGVVFHGAGDRISGILNQSTPVLSPYNSQFANSGLGAVGIPVFDILATSKFCHWIFQSKQVCGSNQNQVRYHRGVEHGLGCGL